MKFIPNLISISRIIFSFSLIFVMPLSIAFLAIYFICGLSDIVYGFIARSTGTTRMLLPFIHPIELMYVLCFIASVSAIEEFIIQLISSELNANRKSIFIK
jgi:CDP-alcohol phosphatidyltransferase.